MKFYHFYNELEIEKAGATVRKMKIRSAIQYGLNLGPFQLVETKEKEINKYFLFKIKK